ncbi:hypothetical protein [Bradyrhizobium aeschynomenes]|uniref:hypothetical protein n=1 Tax=Bradyrhizobium aeschynomenes TaxID=2734909 RepID=UPI001FEDA6AD|nr:hypothetical protein [Bradyrhizobium aeschynomenes]
MAVPARRGGPAALSTDAIWSPLVPYALFENDERLTRPFRTEREVWEAAEQADLVTLDAHGEKVLDNSFEIKPCDAAPDELVGSGQDIVIPRARGADTSRENGSQLSPSRQKNTTQRSS